jgi:hypothetical protein
MSKVTIDKFLVCDDVRCEVGGKLILIGVYPGNMIALQGIPYQIAFTSYLEAKCPMNGEYRGTLTVENDSGNILVTHSVGFLVANANQNVPLFVPLSFSVEKSQTYKIKWLLDRGEAGDIGSVHVVSAKSAP